MLATLLTVGHIEVLALLDGVDELSGPMAEHFPDVPRSMLDASRDHLGTGEDGLAGWRPI
jgi:hypothetical protein